MKLLKIDKTNIGRGNYPYIIAEMSANHANNIEVAIQTIQKAKECGANAVKLQTYTADTLTLNCKKPWFKAKGAWSGQYLYDLYQNAAMPWEWTQELMNVAKDIGITIFSSPFDESAVDFLESLDMCAYKIASPELIDIPFIKYVAQTNKPIILSTGNATIAQIQEACEAIFSQGNKKIAILKCTSEYPANPKDINLKTISTLQNLFHVPVGLSDHTIGASISIASVSFEASIIEKHFVLDKNIKSADSFFSATPEVLQTIVEGTKAVYDAIGETKFPTKTLPAQRSLVAIKNIKKNEKLIYGQNYKSLRPGGGIEPKYREFVEQKGSNKDILYGSLLTWDMIGG